MGIFRRIFGKKEEPTDQILADTGVALDEGRIASMFERSPSFSVVAIPGDISMSIPLLLSEFGYKVLRTGAFSGEFEEVYAALAEPSGPNNDIVQKAWYLTAGHTILIDPEMVLITAVEQLSRLATLVQASIKVAIWERVSETVALVEIGPQGVVRQTWYCQGEPSEEGIEVHSEIVERPDNVGLRSALAGYELSEDSVFGSIDATVVELQA